MYIRNHQIALLDLQFFVKTKKRRMQEYFPVEVVTSHLPTVGFFNEILASLGMTKPS